MGNENSGKNLKNYYFTCHHGFSRYEIYQEEELLQMKYEIDEKLVIWRQKINPLLAKKHILFPARIQIVDYNLQVGCCSVEQFRHPERKEMKVLYQPFIYCLDKEITSRKIYDTIFRQQQIWKILGYTCKAILQWKQCYPQERFGTLCPSNIVLNTKGAAKIVTKISFFHDSYEVSDSIYNPPESRTNSIIKYSFNPHSDPAGIESFLVYSLGVTLLETTTLDLSYQSNLIVKDKIQLLLSNKNYSVSLKELIIKMVDENYSLRPKIMFMLNEVKSHKNRHL